MTKSRASKSADQRFIEDHNDKPWTPGRCADYAGRSLHLMRCKRHDGFGLGGMFCRQHARIRERGMGNDPLPHNLA